MSKYEYNKDYFTTIDTEYKAYWLGFLYADGSINRYYKNEKLRSMSLELGLSDKDRHHLEKFKKCLNANVPIAEKFTKLNGKEYKSARITINNTKLCYDLCDLGCTPKKTYDIEFPTYDIVPKQFMRDFLRGLFDGDGCISISEMSGNPHIFTSITGMKNMLDGISNFLLEEKIVRVRPTIIQDKRRLSTYSMCIYGKDTNKEFLDYLYKGSHIYLDRKYDQYINFYQNYNDIEKRGVYYDKYHNVYVASIRINGVKKTSRHKNLEDAIQARKEFEIEKLNITKKPA